MATTYLSPGVHVEELSKGIKPIRSLGSSVAAFVGITERASVKQPNPVSGVEEIVESRLNKATLITSWRQYINIFGEFVPGAYLPDAVYAYFTNGGGSCYITSIRTTTEGDATALAASVVVPAAKGNSFKVTANIVGDVMNSEKVIVSLEKDGKGKATGAFTLSVGGEVISGLNMKKGDANYIGSAKFGIATISDVSNSPPAEGESLLSGGGMAPLTVADFVGNVADRTGMSGFEAHDEIRLLLCPDIMAGYDGSADAKERVKAIQAAMIAHCERLRYTFSLLDTPPGLTAQEVKEWREYVNFDSSHAAMYYPWVKVADFSDSPNKSKLVPPSGHMVGIYNRTDAERGVHKAPANEVLRGTIDLETRITKAEQGLLNPIGVNCIREFPGRGIRIWGARTLASDGEWRYINVRRLFILIESSMEVGLQWVVFEPNDQDLWARVRRDVIGFLSSLWRAGALSGTTRDDAFYVKCDAELNPPEVRDLGQLIIEAGVCPVKPAEFVVFRLSQWAGPNAI